MTGAKTRFGFVADSRGNVAEILCSDGVSRAHDIMTADRVPAETAAKMAVAAERDGRDPVAFAEHYVKMRKVLRDLDAAKP